MSYFVAGGGVAACCHPGFAQTNLFAVNQNGRLCALAVQGVGVWTSPLPLTLAQFAMPGAFLVASPDFGAPLPGTDLFVVDATGTLQLFAQAAPGLSWRRQSLSARSQFVSGSQAFTVLPGTLPPLNIINQINVLIFDKTGTLHWYHRDADQLWNLDTSIELGSTAANANIAGLVRYSNSQVAQELSFYFVDSNGTLNCWTNTGALGWQGGTIPLGGFELNPGTQLAASVRFGTALKETDLDDANVFAVDSKGDLLCYSFGATGKWQVTSLTSAEGLLSFAPPGSPLAAGRQYLNPDSDQYQTDVFVVRNDRTINVFSSQDGNPWSVPELVAANAADAGSFLASAPQAGTPPPDSPTQTDLFLCDLFGDLNVCQVDDAGAWQRNILPTGFDPNVHMLQGPEQIVFSTGKAFLTDLQVDIAVTEDLVPALQIDVLGNPVGGLAIQLNCNGAPDVASPWEQFSILLSPYSFYGTPSASALSTGTQCWSLDANFVVNSVLAEDYSNSSISLPVKDTPRIPAGYSLRTVLKATGPTIDEAQFYVFGIDGKQMAHWDTKLLKVTLAGSHKKVATSDLSKVVCFQLNIVGFGGGQQTQLLSGAGTITYKSTATALTPAIIQHSPTGEDSNCIYSTVSPETSNTFVQHFQVLP